MQRDLLLPGEMIHAAERAHQLTNGLTLEDLQADQLRSESLLWNFTVLGEAAAQLPGDVKDRFPNVPWQQPARLRNRIVHGYWSIDLEILHTTATSQLPAFARDLREVLNILTADTDETTPAQAPDTAPATSPTQTSKRQPSSPAAPALDTSK